MYFSNLGLCINIHENGLFRYLAQKSLALVWHSFRFSVEKEMWIVIQFSLPALLAWAQLRGLSAVIHPARLLPQRKVSKIPPPLAFLLLSGRYVEQCLPSTWRKLLCDFLWHELGHQLGLDFYPRPIFTKLCELKKNLKQKSQSPWKCFYVICSASKVLKGLVFSEAEMWKEWQFALVWSLEERACL